MPYKPRFRGEAQQPFRSINPQNPDDSGLEKPARSNEIVVISVIIIVVGVLYVYWQRNSNIHTGPAVTVLPNQEADVSQVENMVGTVNALINTNQQLGAQ